MTQDAGSPGNVVLVVVDGLSPKYVARIVGDAFRRAAVPESGHALRHTFANDLLRNGGNLRDAQVALGHVSIATTQRYLGFTAVRELRGLMEGGRGGVTPAWTRLPADDAALLPPFGAVVSRQDDLPCRCADRLSAVHPDDASRGAVDVTAGSIRARRG